MANNQLKVTKSDWERILQTMTFYKRKSGFVDFLGNKLTYFDSDPRIDNVHACPVTQEQVVEYIESFNI